MKYYIATKNESKVGKYYNSKMAAFKALSKMSDMYNYRIVMIQSNKD